MLFEFISAAKNTDINECQTDNGGCAQKCINTDGSHECACDDGYEMTGDRHTCIGEFMYLLTVFTDQ